MSLLARTASPAARFLGLGFGSAPIGNLYRPVSDEDARAAVVEALNLDVSFFDTAPHYGFGLSETRLGAALAELDPHERLIVSTKVGRRLAPAAAGDAGAARHGFVAAAPYEPVFDYTYDGVMRSYEGSRERLRRSRIDILLAHDLGRRTHGGEHPRKFREFMEGGYRAMRELRDSGAVGAIGLGVNEWQVCEEALAAAEFDVVLLAGRYTLLEQTALDSFLPLCAARGVAIIIGGPYNSGILSRGVRTEGAPACYDYAPAPAWVLERVARLQSVCSAHGVPLGAAALQFPLAHPQVVGVIPGVASAEEMRQARQWLDTPIPEAMWEQLREDGLLPSGAPTPGARSQPDLILLHPDDNVLICIRPVPAGGSMTIDDKAVSAAIAIPLGHKVARRRLSPGDRIFKHGAPIGSASTAIHQGEHVHLHNMRSDYLPSHTREAFGSAEAG